jgi:hypothetical protein
VLNEKAATAGLFGALLRQIRTTARLQKPTIQIPLKNQQEPNPEKNQRSNILTKN